MVRKVTPDSVGLAAATAKFAQVAAELCWNGPVYTAAADGTPYFIEANPNPEIAKVEEFAQSAMHDGLKYPDLLNRILTLGIARGSGARVGA